MFGNIAERTEFVTLTSNGQIRKSSLAGILERLGEDPKAPEYQETPGIQAVAETFVSAGIAKGIVILLDGSAILSAGNTDAIPTSVYN